MTRPRDTARETVFTLRTARGCPCSMPGSTDVYPTNTRAFESFAAPTGDQGIADVTPCFYESSRWRSKGKGGAAFRGWQASENLMQFMGILKTPGLGSACVAWEHVVDVE